ncbi:serine hydrolase domain-containing protein [Chitinimonas sp. JJ19]|uniref:serine hydrolase domain-containing protein n=1 Tax=Chitinimonas sp. JJ19 TaxID=3109352 RepID=UPI002FFE547E
MNITVKRAILGCLVSLSFTASANIGVDPATNQAIEKILSEFNSPGKPAFAVTVINKGKPIYEKAFGSANLEYKTPATVDTKFQVDAFAWEFIAYATLTLEAQGKIKLDDDIRKYLPELPDLGEKVTVDHLLSSTDGYYGYKTLKSLSGWETKDPEQHKSILQVIKSQKVLNFKPGKAFSPNGDTRLILLARIVESVTGLSFDAYCNSQIFAPLGMSNTVFLYDSNQAPDNTAIPYRSDSNGTYKRDYGDSTAPGPVNLYTSIRDISIWRSHMSSRTPGVRPLVNKLNSPIKLDGGAPIKDVASISNYGQQHVGKERGIPKIYLRGISGGYSSTLFRFPEQDFSVIVLSSGLAYNGSYGMQIANLFMNNHFPEPETIDYTKIEGVKLSRQQLQQFVGNYWNPVRALSARVHLKDDVLYYSRVDGSDGNALIPIDNSTFQVTIEGDDKILLKFVDKAGGKDMNYTVGDSDPVVFESYKPTSYANNEMAQFTGTFHSNELNASFVFDVNKGVLTASNIRSGTIKFKPLSPDMFSGDKSFMRGIRFIRGSNNEVTGFKVAVDTVRSLVFKKAHEDDNRKLSSL